METQFPECVVYEVGLLVIYWPCQLSTTIHVFMDMLMLLTNKVTPGDNEIMFYCCSDNCNIIYTEFKAILVSTCAMGGIVIVRFDHSYLRIVLIQF